jgi:hypothetical protein
MKRKLSFWAELGAKPGGLGGVPETRFPNIKRRITFWRNSAFPSLPLQQKHGGHSSDPASDRGPMGPSLP